MSILQVGISIQSSSSSSAATNLQLAPKFISSVSNVKIINNNCSNSRISVKRSTYFSSRISCSANGSLNVSSDTVKEKSVSVVLLAGGKGTRMGASMPKQYLPLLGQPIALYSFFTFSLMPEVKEIIVVCDPSYRDIFEDTKQKLQVELKFALPGKERQDSVYSGLQAVDLNSELVCIHDSARPLVTSEDVKKVKRSPRGVRIRAKLRLARERASNSVDTSSLDTVCDIRFC